MVIFLSKSEEEMLLTKIQDQIPFGQKTQDLVALNNIKKIEIRPGFYDFFSRLAQEMPEKKTTTLYIASETIFSSQA